MPEKPPAVKESKEPFCRRRWQYGTAIKNKIAVSSKGVFRKRTSAVKEKIRDNKRNSVFTGLLLSKTGYAMHDVHLAARMPETFLNSVCTEK